MRNNNLIQRQKRHAQAYMRIFAQQERMAILTVKALHHVQMAHLAWRARHEFKRCPREISPGIFVMWHPTVNKWHDQGRVAHALGDNGKAICGASAYAFGGGSTNIEYVGGQKCQRCIRVLWGKSR